MRTFLKLSQGMTSVVVVGNCAIDLARLGRHELSRL
jgi:hypothetical protein